jgi:hypothetical protein
MSELYFTQLRNYEIMTMRHFDVKAAEDLDITMGTPYALVDPARVAYLRENFTPPDIPAGWGNFRSSRTRVVHHP